MASGMLTVTAALLMLDIPFPEEDMSDEFDGYIDPDDIPAYGFDDLVGDDIDEQEFDEGVPPI